MIITKNNLVKKLNYGIYDIYLIEEKIKYSDLLEIVFKISKETYPRSMGKSYLHDRLYLKPIIFLK